MATRRPPAGSRSTRIATAAVSAAAGVLLGTALVAALAWADIYCQAGVTCNGNGQDNVMHGTNYSDTIIAAGGTDVVFGNPERDHLYGQDGQDYVDGGGAIDQIYGGAQADIFNCGGIGSCALMGGGDNDEIYGGDDIDAAWGQDGADYVVGETGNDALVTSDDDAPVDTIVGGGGYDYCYYDPGDSWSNCEELHPQ